MQIPVTGLTEDQGFAPTRGHDLDPSGFLSAVVGVQIFECPDMVGSGAAVPLQGSSVTRPQNRAYTFRCTRLAIYALLEMLSVRECACMKLVMTGAAENQRFSAACCHHPLPQRFSFCYIFQFSHMMHLKRPLPRLTVLA
jgi:hypothetical protein